jgi:Undecaprenyl-phosphate glucose phosphotransferase
MFRLDPKQAILEHVADSRETRENTLGQRALAIAAEPAEPVLSSRVIIGIAQLVEAALLACIGIGLVLVAQPAEAPLHATVVFGAVAVANFALNLVRTHRIASYRLLVDQLGRVLAAWSAVFIAITLILMALDHDRVIVRGLVVAFYAGGAVGLVAFRLLLHLLVIRWTAEGKLRRRTAIVGGGRDAEELVEAMRRGAPNDISLLGLFDDRNDSRSPESVASLPKLGRVADLISFARATRVDLVIVSMPLSAEKRVLEMLKQLWVLPVDIRLSAHMSRLRFSSRAYSYLGDVAVLDIADRPISDWNLVFKWLFDKTVAVVALVLLSPVMVATAIAIKLESKGPVIFKQKRHGFNNELIEVYKFRSMYTDRADANAARLVTRDDPRVTRVGRFIRKTSLDELPQFINVLQGRLSVVGPRPHALQAKADNKLYYEAVDGYFARHKVKPGITGWAQINGWRGETDTVDKIMQRVQFDLHYIENWSILMDAYILVMTPVRLFTSSNAY